jgi:predicted RNA-binding protein
MRIILKQGDREEVVLENAALLKVTAEGIVVSAMFESPRLIPDAAVTLIDFLENKVTVTRTVRKG